MVLTYYSSFFSRLKVKDIHLCLIKGQSILKELKVLKAFMVLL